MAFVQKQGSYLSKFTFLYSLFYEHFFNLIIYRARI